MTGVVTGGWEFVWAAYGISFAVLTAYGFRLASKLRRSREHEDR
jgi:hypothetical protein